MSSFKGFSPEAFTFYAELEQDNSKTFWDANKERWENIVHEPMQDFLEALEKDFPPFRLFRPTRDLRFSKDKSPYKLWIGASSDIKGGLGIGYYVRLGASGLMAGYGAHVMERDQLERFRNAIDHDVYGAEFEEIAQKLAALSLPVTSGGKEPLKTVPPGYAKDHPRIEFLRWKGASIIKEFDRTEKWLHTPRAVDKVREVWQTEKPFRDWLNAHVGESREPSGRLGSHSRKVVSAGQPSR